MIFCSSLLALCSYWQARQNKKTLLMNSKVYYETKKYELTNILKHNKIFIVYFIITLAVIDELLPIAFNIYCPAG